MGSLWQMRRKRTNWYRPCSQVKLDLVACNSVGLQFSTTSDIETLRPHLIFYPLSNLCQKRNVVDTIDNEAVSCRTRLPQWNLRESTLQPSTITRSKSTSSSDISTMILKPIGQLPSTAAVVKSISVDRWALRLAMSHSALRSQS